MDVSTDNRPPTPERSHADDDIELEETDDLEATDDTDDDIELEEADGTEEKEPPVRLNC